MKPHQYTKSILIAAFIATAASASAQNFSYFYGENVQGGGYTDVLGLPSDFNMEQYNENTGALSSGATESSVSPDTTALGIQGFSTVLDLGTFGDQHSTPGFTEVVTGVTLYLWVTNLSPLASTTTFQIYDGLGGRTGTLIGDVITLTEPNSEQAYVAITIPSSLWDGDFSIGKSGQNSSTLFNTVTDNGTAANRPGFAVTTTLVAIPEPTSAALLGGLGLMALIRRRRA